MTLSTQISITFKHHTHCGIAVYLNHRPAFGLEPEKLLWAFDVLGMPNEDDNMAIERGEMLDILQNRGIHIE